jgi:hypothetical protein
MKTEDFQQGHITLMTHLGGVDGIKFFRQLCHERPAFSCKYCASILAQNKVNKSESKLE